MEKEYIIKQKTKSVFEIHKFLNGRVVQTYEIKGHSCSCLSGRYRKTCKHKDWVSSLKNKQPLPDFITIAMEANV